MEFAWFILVGLVAGWFAGMLVRGGGFGILGDIAVGIVGAMIGGHFVRFFGMTVGTSLPWRIAVATVGAVLLVVILRVIKRA